MTALYAMERPGTNQLLLLGWFADESSQLDIENAQFSRKCKTYIYILHCNLLLHFFHFLGLLMLHMFLYGACTSLCFQRFAACFVFFCRAIRNQDFPEGSLIGTASLRRQARSEVRFLELQSNFDCQESTTKKLT